MAKKRKKRRWKPWVRVTGYACIALMLCGILYLVLQIPKQRAFYIGGEKVNMPEVSFYALQMAYDNHITNEEMLDEMYDGDTNYRERYKLELQKTIIQTKILFLYACRKGYALSVEDQRELDSRLQDWKKKTGLYWKQHDVSEKLARRVLGEQILAEQLKKDTISGRENLPTYFHTCDMLLPTVQTGADGMIKTNADGTPVSVTGEQKEEQYRLAMKALELARSKNSLQEAAKELALADYVSDVYGDWERYESGEYLTELEGLSENDIGGVVETSLGYHVFQVVAKDDKAYAEMLYSLEDSEAALAEYIENWSRELGVNEEKMTGKAWARFDIADYVQNGAAAP